MNSVVAKRNENMADAVNSYKTPLAKWARLMEIIIPAYMLGKSWGIAEPKNLELFKAQFPPAIISMTEVIKSVVHVGSIELQRFISTTSGAIMGLFAILLLSIIMHLILHDRKYVDSLRFTAVTSLPVAVMNGIFSHGLQTLMDNSTLKSAQALKAEALYTPWSYFILNFVFYLLALWVMGKRTGVEKRKRWVLVCIGVLVMGLYVLGGLMVFPNEWTGIAQNLIKN